MEQRLPPSHHRPKRGPPPTPPCAADRYMQTRRHQTPVGPARHACGRQDLRPPGQSGPFSAFNRQLGMQNLTLPGLSCPGLSCSVLFCPTWVHHRVGLGWAGAACESFVVAEPAPPRHGPPSCGRQRQGSRGNTTRPRDGALGLTLPKLTPANLILESSSKRGNKTTQQTPLFESPVSKPQICTPGPSSSS